MKYQKTSQFVSPDQAYRQAGIELRTLSMPLFKAIRAGDPDLAAGVLAGDIV